MFFLCWCFYLKICNTFRITRRFCTYLSLYAKLKILMKTYKWWETCRKLQILLAFSIVSLRTFLDVKPNATNIDSTNVCNFFVKAICFVSWIIFKYSFPKYYSNFNIFTRKNIYLDVYVVNKNIIFNYLRKSTTWKSLSALL